MTDAAKIGAAGENFTANRLMQRGYRILAKNYHTRYGELDIIAASPKYIVFVEVKTRLPNANTGPEESVTASKQRKLIAAAEIYLQRNPTSLQPRFDVASVIMEYTGQITGFRYLPNAFGEKGLF